MRRRGIRGARRLRLACALAAAVAGLSVPWSAAHAQQPAPRAAATLSEVDSLLARGRLAAAEQALYAAVEARPRAPEARGALAWYLASRARFVIADVLFTEALRFGADSTAVARARAAIAPYRERPAGPQATVPFVFAEDGRTLGRFEARAAGGPVTVLVDPNASGVAVASAAEARALGRALTVGTAGTAGTARTVGERRLAVTRATVDPALRPGEVRLGLDLFFGHAPRFDERAGTLTLGAPADDPVADDPAAAAPVAAAPVAEVTVPFVLGMPGLWLVERAGVRPVPVESPWGRALLRGSRWRVDADRSVVVIAR